MKNQVISIYLFKAYTQRAANGSDIARNIRVFVYSVKLSVSESIIARALNRVLRNCDWLLGIFKLKKSVEVRLFCTFQR